MNRELKIGDFMIFGEKEVNLSNVGYIIEIINVSNQKVFYKRPYSAVFGWRDPNEKYALDEVLVNRYRHLTNPEIKLLKLLEIK